MFKAVYKIRRKSDGKFSRGGCCPSFGKDGKAWAGLGPLKSHLRLVSQLPAYGDPDYGTVAAVNEHYAGCEIVRYDVVTTTTEGNTTPVGDFCNEFF
jgi:hypothetical protein